MASLSVHLVINRSASRLRAEGPLLRALLNEAHAAGEAVRVHETRALAELDAVAAEIVRDRADAVILAGGDGSYMSGVSALARRASGQLPPVALAPGGTVSTVARNWGMKGDLVEHARRLVRSVVRGEAVHHVRPTLRVHERDGVDRVGFIFGTGLVASFFAVYDAAPAKGYAAAAVIAARVFAGSFVGGRLARRVLTPLPCRLEVDGRAQAATAYSLVVASVVPDLGIGMRVTYRAAVERDRVHLVASSLPPLRLGPQLPRVLAGRPLLGKGHVDTLASSFAVEFAPGPGPYVLDGDLLQASRVEVSAGPLLRLLMPRSR